MADISPSADALIEQLVTDLRPVRRLVSPALRGLAWLSLVAATAAVLAWFADMPAVENRLMAATDMWLSVVGSVLTAVLATFAAVQLGLPDRSPRWALLPLPGLALWLGASGVGCARNWLIPGTEEALMVETGRCLRFIILLSVPLSLAIFWLLRRGYSLYPTLMGGTAGLAVAAAAASLLVFFHPFDATVEDLAVHAAAVLIVVLASRAYGRRLFGAQKRS